MGVFSGVKNFFTGSKDKKEAGKLAAENMKMTRMEFEEQWRRGHLQEGIREAEGVAQVGASGVQMRGSPETARVTAEKEFKREMDWLFQASEQKRRIEKRGGQRAQTAATQAAIGRTTSTGLATAGTVASFLALSSRELKDVQGHPTPADLIDGLMSLEITRWRYKEGLNDTEEHVGPFAEEFQAAFDLGNGETINLVDAVGVLFAIAQEQQKQIDRLKQFVMVD